MCRYLFLFFLCALTHFSIAQHIVPVYKGALKQNRTTLLKNLQQKTIRQNLTKPLADSTEEDWKSAFYAMALLNYKAPQFVEPIQKAASYLPHSSLDFQQQFWTFVYKRYPVIFAAVARRCFDTTNNAKLMAICGEYLLSNSKTSNQAKAIFTKIENAAKKDSSIRQNPFFLSLAVNARITMGFGKETPFERSMNLLKWLPFFLDSTYLPGQVVVYSFQRKNRDYPGLAIVRTRNGNFFQNPDGSVFAIPQLARSIYNSPSYISYGNTPQGVFRMKGFDISKIGAIGPTENIQLMLPVEASVKHFFNDSTRSDTIWTRESYAQILPRYWRGNLSLYEAWYAGLAGRNEIIAHGTTIDPSYYSGSPYFPQTPTVGCLCTKEIWSGADGKRLESDQQKLVDAVKQSGGADGYFVVIELNDENKPVTWKDVKIYVDMANKISNNKK